MAQFNELADRDVPCRTPGCPNTWLWKRGAQLAELQRAGRLRRPARLCSECLAADRETKDLEMPCKIGGCKRHWTWTRDAQVRHRQWALRQRARAEAAAQASVSEAETTPEPNAIADADVPVAEADGATVATEVVAASDASDASDATDTPDATAPAASEATEASDVREDGERRKRRRKRRRAAPAAPVEAAPNWDRPPQRMCGPCATRLERTAAREQPCKVHGCVRTWNWDRTSQMKAWVASGSDDPNLEIAAPRRMCEPCRDFCKGHGDREVACGRPGCERTWTYKTGAQLQAFLAGRTGDPLRLCSECGKGDFAAMFPASDGPVEGAETMPCIMPGCDGTWMYIPGMRLRDVPYGVLAPDRMCDSHRAEHGLSPATVEIEDISPADLEHDDAAAHAGDVEPDSPDTLHAPDAPEGSEAPEALADTEDVAADESLDAAESQSEGEPPG